MTAKRLEIEGTWEEIVSHSDALAGVYLFSTSQIDCSHIL